MGLSFVQKNEGIHPAHSSIKYIVESDEMTEQVGSLGSAVITFNSSTVNDLDYFTILGVKIVFKTNAVFMNEIDIIGAAYHSASFEYILINNSTLSTQLDYTKTQSGSSRIFTLTMKNGDKDIDIEHGQGSGFVIVNNNTFTPLFSKKEYNLNINLLGNQSFIDNIYTSFLAVLNFNKTDIEKAVTEFELPISVSNTLFTPLPSLIQKQQLMPNFYSKIKLLLNDKWSLDDSYQDGFLLVDETLTVINATFIAETPWSIFDDGDNERQSFYINTPSDYCTPQSAFRFITLYAKAGKNVIISFFNNNGSVLQSFTVAITADGFHQISIGILSYQNELTVDVSDIKSVSVLYEKVVVVEGLSVLSSPVIHFNYCNCPSENFIFLSKFGTYETISLNPILTVKDKINRTSVQFAEQETENVIESSIQKTYRANFFELETYSEDEEEATRFLLDFVNSTETYWIVDDKYIKIEPVTATIDSFSRVKRIHEKFEFRTSTEYALKQ